MSIDESCLPDSRSLLFDGPGALLVWPWSLLLLLFVESLRDEVGEGPSEEGAGEVFTGDSVVSSEDEVRAEGFGGSAGFVWAFFCSFPS